MSLISEALKKAEREAAARETRGKGPPEPFDSPLQPYRSRRGGRSRAPRFALIAGGIALILLFVFWWSAGRRVPPVEAAIDDFGAGADARGGPGFGSGDRCASAAPAGPGASLSPPGGRGDRGATGGATGGARRRGCRRCRRPELLRRKPCRPCPSRNRPAASRRPGRWQLRWRLRRRLPSGSGDYLRRVEFRDGTKLELGGIVYSETSPFAYLNGRLVGVGEFVAGRRIDRIERDRVVLSGDAGEIILRLK